MIYKVIAVYFLIFITIPISFFLIFITILIYLKLIGLKFYNYTYNSLLLKKLQWFITNISNLSFWYSIVARVITFFNGYTNN